MSHPENVWKAEHKIFQLNTARQIGFQIPETIVTNCPEQALTAFKRFKGEMIAKAVRSGYLESREQPYAIYTSQVLNEHLEHLSKLSESPVVFQKLIHKKSDIRVTVVGSKIFASEILSQTDPYAKLDWRKTENPNLPHKKIQLPSKLQSLIFKYMNLLGLSYGAIDFIRTKSDHFIFLEINPNGQWLWIENILNHPIADAISDWLLGNGKN